MPNNKKEKKGEELYFAHFLSINATAATAMTITTAATATYIVVLAMSPGPTGCVGSGKECCC